jgi:hypothetical protein
MTIPILKSDKEEHYSVRDNVKYMHVNGLDYVKSII